MGWGVGGRMWWAGKYERGRPGRVVWGVVASGRVGWGGEWGGPQFSGNLYARFSATFEEEQSILVSEGFRLFVGHITLRVQV